MVIGFRLTLCGLALLLSPCDFAMAANAEQQAIVSALSGHAPLTDGTLLQDRASLANRQKVRDFLASLFQSLGLAPQRHVYRQGAENVFAEIAATSEGAETIVIGAHYDSVQRSPGANDNATGIALAHMVARAVSEEPCRTRAVTVVYFDEEELGLRGSRAFARKLTDEDRLVRTVHSVDQMGWDRDEDRAIELELPPPTMLALYERHAAESGITVHATRTDTTDHAAFRAAGFDALGLTEEYVNGDTTPHYHRSTDKYVTVNFDYLESSTMLMTRVIVELATEGC